MISKYSDYWITFLLSGLVLSLAYFLPAGRVWLLRLLILVLLVLAGLKLKHFALIPAIFSVLADRLYLLFPARSLSALDPLVWAVFICVPYFIVVARENRGEEKQIKSGESKKSVDKPISRNSDQLLFFQSREQQSEDPRELVKKLITSFFNSQSEQLGFCNLLYFHVRSKKATLGYLINKVGEIKEDCVFSPDIGQGIGWVLRHEEKLKIPGNQLDWRNLQYHLQPVELGHVWLSPIKYGGELIGVLALEWKKNERPDDREMKIFNEQVQQLMVLDHSVRRLVKNKKQIRIIEKLYEINPLSGGSYRDILQRVFEIVTDFIPAENIDFYTKGGKKLEKVAPPARRKLYEQCLNWIFKSEKILRIKDLRTESLAGSQLDRFGQTGVRSLLAGPVYADEKLMGVVVLDHSEPGFFTEDEERILKLLFKQLGQILKVANYLRRLKNERDQGLELFSLLELPEEADLRISCRFFVNRLVEKLNIHGAGFYWWNNNGFQLVHYKGPGKPTVNVDIDDTLVRRLKNSARDSGLLSFPDVNHIDGYEAPVGVRSLFVSGMFKQTKLKGFVVIFQEPDQQFSKKIKKTLDSVHTAVGGRFVLLGELESWQHKARLDAISNFPVYKNWKKMLAECLRENPAKVTIWHFQVPGFEKIGVKIGKKKLDSWLKSISRLLSDNLGDSQICRVYGSVFYGFCLREIGEVEETLADVVVKLEDWEFPTGVWPSSPRFLSASFSAPYPGPEKIIQAPTYSSANREEK
ncbi:MAG: GAF domain-containing protein [bacterium]